MSTAKSASQRWLSLIPNGLTIGRLVAAVLFPLCSGEIRIALLLYAGISDLVDGEIGRRLGATTRLGQTLDPIADKAVILSVAMTLLWEGSIAWWQLPLVAAREIAVVGISAVVATRRSALQMETSPLVIGKIATGGQFAFLLSILWWPTISMGVFVIAALLSVAAAVGYTYDAITQMRNLSRDAYKPSRSPNN